jgi:hypothetical protein
MGNNTIRTEIITPLNDGNEARNLGIRLSLREKPTALIGFEKGHLGASGPALFGLTHHVAKSVHVMRTTNDIEVRHLLQHALPFLLGDTAAHGKNQSGTPLLKGLEATEMPIHFAFGTGTNGTGIENDEISRFGAADPDVAKLLHKIDDLFGVDHIHLAPEGLQVKIFHHCDYRS